MEPCFIQVGFTTKDLIEFAVYAYIESMGTCTTVRHALELLIVNELEGYNSATSEDLQILVDISEHISKVLDVQLRHTYGINYRYINASLWIADNLLVTLHNEDYYEREINYTTTDI